MTQIMTLENVRSIAPSVFAEHPWEGVSSRYAFIPTVKIVQSLLSEGWDITKAEQQKTRIEGKGNFTRHLLRFRRPGNDFAVEGLYPEIILINSHDRGSAFQMHAGFFRLVCFNGMIVADLTFGKISIRHSGNVIDDVRRGADEIAGSLPKMLESVKEMQAIELTPDERGVFAMAAKALKYDENDTIKPSEILRARRTGDEKNDLWTTMNVIQENLTKGGVRYLKPAHRNENGNYIPSSRRRTMAIKSIQEDIRINKALWLLAEEMKIIKTK
jgi:hypothetical protein